MTMRYTEGGSPIIHVGGGKWKRTASDRNTRFRCSDKSCPHKTTKNQAKLNGDTCFSCKKPLAYKKGSLDE